ncbi:sigma-54-dependent Fis family transcriptional regulator [Pseudoalteromonas sp. J010]|uniref:sigma-54-dependent transcriptional regulator n=1 Tax=Pseudoalteromonas sp. J010 TaxID=998465 RepID=UPI000F64E134|nr:sigma-54 dependent transcriptional regulator [Pseudoalteromonas sp. J010]RRS06538.1 sigma-54-dependent Fis family transcriptional regulator [Pseudoalteromonas sp. J010]
MTAVLIIEDNPDVRMSATILLQSHGYQSIEASHPDEAKVILAEQPVALILLDMNFNKDTTSGKEGLQFLMWLRQVSIEVPLIVITAWAKVELAVQAMQLGACDLIEKPWQNQRLLKTVKRHIETRQTTTEPPTNNTQNKMPSRLLQQALRVAKTDANVLILGENGSGKSQLARYIHNNSLRSEQPFVSVNMAAIPTELFESELFGHRQGAFTDAKANRTGRFEMAQNGTLFLDEIGSLPVAQQAKLLRVLESGEYEVLGDSKTSNSNARIISATNVDLSDAVKTGLFRQDLLYRLNTVILTVPALRARADELPSLAAHFLALHTKRHGNDTGGERSLSNAAIAKMKAYSWPGNIRELSHVIERAVILGAHSVIGAQDLELDEDFHEQDMPLLSLEEAEKRMIENAIRHFEGNVVAAGEFLGLSKSAIYRRVEKHEIKLKGNQGG